MSLNEFLIQPHYCLSLATLRKEGSSYILNTVRDLKPAEVDHNSIGVLQIDSGQCTAWVIATPQCLYIGGSQALCIVCTCAHILFSPFAKGDENKNAIFTFGQTESEIIDGLSPINCHQAFLLYSPVDTLANDPEYDPISGNPFSIPHDLSLFLVLKRYKEETANLFPVNPEPLRVHENTTVEGAILGYPLVNRESIEALILPDMENLGFCQSQVEEAFKASKSLVASPGVVIQKSVEDNLIPVTNPAAPRLSGAPMLIK